MPLTLAHPAAALPLRRPLGRFAVPSALVIGSIVPDIAYFIPWSIGRASSHSFIGLFGFCLPIGVVLYLGFHLLVAPMLYALLPSPLRSRSPIHWASGVLPKARPAAVLVSLFMGAVTHVVWDSFTHEDGAAVRALPFLATPLFTWGGYTLFVCRVLQHTSTLIGLGLLVSWGRQWFRRATSQALSPGPPVHLRVVLALLVVVPPLVVGMGSGWGRAKAATGVLRWLEVFVGQSIFTGGAAFLICLLAVSVVWRYRMMWRWPSARSSTH